MRIIAISQFENDAGVKNDSYEEDDRESMEGFLDHIIQKETDIAPQPPTIPEGIAFSPADVRSIVLDYSDLNIVYNIAGYILCSIYKVSKTCSDCQEEVFAETPVAKYGKFVS